MKQELRVFDLAQRELSRGSLVLVGLPAILPCLANTSAPAPYGAPNPPLVGPATLSWLSSTRKGPKQLGLDESKRSVLTTELIALQPNPPFGFPTLPSCILLRVLHHLLPNNASPRTRSRPGPASRAAATVKIGA